jgi:glutamate/tyrosine decarboxylase-like PLP-dependent enzyme
MDTGALAAMMAQGNGPAIVCAQAGNVATGAFDAFGPIADVCAENGAWLHVDGAFGLWAAAAPGLRSLTAGVERADSGRSTRTSGSTCRTTAPWPSSPTRPHTSRR